MKSSLFIALVATTALAGCASTDQAVSSAPPVAEPAAVAALPKAAIGTFGFDSAGMDRSIQPGDDFYGFANGTYARNTAIPADKATYDYHVTVPATHVSIANGELTGPLGADGKPPVNEGGATRTWNSGSSIAGGGSKRNSTVISQRVTLWRRS